MKFKQLTPKEPWTVERTQAQINSTQEDIKALNTIINELNSKISGLIEEKMVCKRKISNKQKYINQLEEQIKEKSELPNKDQEVKECDAREAK